MLKITPWLVPKWMVSSIKMLDLRRFIICDKIVKNLNHNLQWNRASWLSKPGRLEHSPWLQMDPIKVTCVTGRYFYSTWCTHWTCRDRRKWLWKWIVLIRHLKSSLIKLFLSSSAAGLFLISRWNWWKKLMQHRPHWTSPGTTKDYCTCINMLCIYSMLIIHHVIIDTHPLSVCLQMWWPYNEWTCVLLSVQSDSDVY